ncbi:hypothetical protein PCE1_003046 [Barthelona sp. PCE]
MHFTGQHIYSNKLFTSKHSEYSLTVKQLFTLTDEKDETVEQPLGMYLTTFCYEPAVIQEIRKHVDNDRPIHIFSDFPGIPPSGVAIDENLRVALVGCSALGQKIFHAKLFLIKFNNFLRICISTGNLDSVCMFHLINNFWVIDIPKLEETQHELPKNTFLHDLQGFLATIGVPYGFLSNYDHRSIENLGAKLIWSIPLNEGLIPAFAKEIHSDILQRPLQRFGRLQEGELWALASSIGNLSSSSMKQYCSAFGVDKIVVFYPSTQYITRNRLQNSSRNFFYPGKRPVECLSEYKPLEHKKLSHSKLMYRMEEGILTHMYIGSHNLSSAAWGKYTTKYSPRNIELGVWLSADSLLNAPLHFVFEESSLPIASAFDRNKI